MAHLQSSGSRPDLALTGTCWHQITASLCNQWFILVTVWQHLALAGIGKQLLIFFNGSLSSLPHSYLDVVFCGL